MKQGGNVMKKLKFTLVAVMIISLAMVAGSALAAGEKPGAATDKPGAATGKPNIVVIWGDDIGLTDVSAYSLGLMGFKTPNIDKIGRAHV